MAVFQAPLRLQLDGGVTVRATSDGLQMGDAEVTAQR